MSPSTENNRGSVIGLVAWVTAVAMCFAVSVKIGTRVAVVRDGRLSVDGVAMIGAMVLALGQMGAISVAIEAGLGEHVDTLTAWQIQRYQQALFAGNILFVTALCLTKLSVIIFFHQSTMGKRPKIVCVVLGSFTIMWVAASILGLAFQCNLPKPWMFIQNTCFNRVAFWYFVVVLDIITDFCVISVPFYTLKFLRLSNEMRLKMIAPFCIRLFIPPIAILRLYFMSNEITADDPTFNTFRVTLLSIVQMNLGIIVSCIPFSKLLITSVQSGLLTTSLHTHVPKFDGTGRSTVFSLSSITQKTTSTSTSQKVAVLGTQGSTRKESLQNIAMPWSDTIHTTHIAGLQGEDSHWGRASPTGSEHHMIQTTTEWAVDHYAAGED